MGLYLCVFEGDDEVDGVEVGSYADFNSFREAVSTNLEWGNWGCRFPTLLFHSDCGGEWTTTDCAALRQELEQIGSELRLLPHVEYPGPWQKDVAKQLGIHPGSLYDIYIDVDGEPLVERLLTLCDVAISHGQPILFQ